MDDTEPRAKRPDTRAEFLPRDFIETAEGLLFAVVAHGTESQRVLGFLRYVRDHGTQRKVATDEANQLLRGRYPEYLFHSSQRDVALHGVPLERIVTHHKPIERMAELLGADGNDVLEQKAVRMARILHSDRCEVPWLGVTGSVLVDAHQQHSDIDLVVHGCDAFASARERLRHALGQGAVQPLDDAMWRATYERRGCSLTFEQYVWHERRKWNKCMIGGTKVDLSCVGPEQPWTRQRGRKVERYLLRATVIDDRDAFSCPARYLIDHSRVQQVISYNPTYTGQAFVGDAIEASGWLEQLANNQFRLLVGTSREAAGEYIRVTQCGSARRAE